MCLGWGESIGISIWVFIAIEWKLFKFENMFGLGWKHWYEHLNIYYNEIGGFQGIKRLSNEQ